MTFFLLVLIILGMLIYFFTFGGYFTVKPRKRLSYCGFGQYVDTYRKDWHWFFPYPVNSFVHIPTNQQYLDINFNAAEMIGMPPEMQAAGRPLKPGRDLYLLTGDFNIIHSAWQMEYKINDPKRYYSSCLTPTDPLQDDPMLKTPEGENMGTRGPQTLLRSGSALMCYQGQCPVFSDEMLYDTKTSTEKVEDLFKKTVADLDIGISIENLQMVKAAPPTTTSKAFSQVTEAKQDQCQQD